VSKILEILILDVHPDVRLKQELQALGVPDVKSAGSSLAVGRSLKSMELIPTISTGQLSVSHQDECLRSTLEDSFLSLQNQVDKLINQMDVLEDKSSLEDEKENEIDLKQYILQVLKVMATDLTEEEYRHLIDRLDKGGIILSSYHSQFGGILNFSEEKEDKVMRSILVKNNKIKNMTNTNILIEKFIHYLFIEYSRFLKDDIFTDPLKSFNQGLGISLSDKSQNLHDYIVRAVANKLYESHHLMRATLWHTPRTSFNREGFIALYSIIHQVNEQDIDHDEIERQSEIEDTLKRIEEAKKRRAERRMTRALDEDLPVSQAKGMVA
jgi:hypothetical protein